MLSTKVEQFYNTMYQEVVEIEISLIFLLNDMLCIFLHVKRVVSGSSIVLVLQCDDRTGTQGF